MKSEYEVVVIGSGYGGSIAASRMARAGRSVCLLEKGREYLPGDFPETTEQAALEMNATTQQGHHMGKENGLYTFEFGEGINVFRGCGLGGTSLVNANVSIEADKRVFEDPLWPAELRVQGALDEGYRLAREMLNPSPYPSHFPKLPKLEALISAATDINAPFQRADINVTFVQGPNSVGVQQQECVGCGDCITGCNYGAKNTLAMNYIPDAFGHGAEIFTQIDVVEIEQGADGWVVHFNPLGHDREIFGDKPMFVRAKVVFVAGGTIGSTALLLQSKSSGLTISNQLGARFSGNGDVLAFAYNCDEPVNSIGWGSHAREKVGPCITGVIDLRGTGQFEEGMVIEDGSIPAPLAELMPAAFAAASRLSGQDTDSGISDFLREKSREVDSLIRGPYHGATRNTLVYLVMSHDNGQGSISLVNSRPSIHWPGVGETPSFRRVYQRLLETTGTLGGTFVRNPISSELFKNQVITVHPLGGCVMAERAEAGVVDHKCRVFRDTTGTATYEGLYVVDASVIPRPLGVNPLLTISAVAERCCALAAADRGWTIDYVLRPIPMPEVEQGAGVEFTETMRGHFLSGAADFKEGEEQGSPFEFTFTIWIEDVERFRRERDHEAVMFGTVRATSLSPEPLTVSKGVFNLFEEWPGKPETKKMLYRAVMVAENGDEFFLDGFKEMKVDPAWNMWAATTTLFVTVYRGNQAIGDPLGFGILHIRPGDFLRQMRTMRGIGSSVKTRMKSLADFGRFFGGNLFELYGGILSGSEKFDAESPRVPRSLRAPAPEVHPVETGDGVPVRLTRYFDGRNAKGPVMLVHGLGVSSRIFTIDTIDTNLVEFLYAHGYDVWVLDFRQSIALPSASMDSTGDDVAAFDFPAAVDYIRQRVGVSTIQVVAHCFGGNAFLMAMLSGLKGVRSAAISQASLFPVTPLLTRIKCGLHVPQVLDALGVDDLTAYTTQEDGWLDKLFNKALIIQPVPFDERCRSDVCHRITFLYSLLYEHDRLNDLTHDALPEMFGVANIEAFKHLALLVNAGQLVNATGEDVYLRNLQMLSVPITFIHGEENSCMLKEGSARSLEALIEANGAGLFDRKVVPGYGHIDCIFGRDAARDVYPHFLNALEPYSKVNP